MAAWRSALLLLALSGCLPAAAPAATRPAPVVILPTALPSVTPTFPPDLTPSLAQKPFLEETTTSPTPGPGREVPSSFTSICSPLEGIQIPELDSPDLLKNPYSPSRPGYDDGHPGIDLAYWTRPDGKAMLGLPVHSVLDGVVAAVLADRQPFGNALIIATSLERIPPDWLAQLNLPNPRHNLQESFSLSCPYTSDFKFSDQLTSIYLLYAHLNQAAEFKTGDQVACGQSVGQVGTTGKSVNPHLHLEARRGPAGLTFASLDHYDSAATPDEMRSYCLWRISGAFQAFDPLKLFALAKNKP